MSKYSPGLCWMGTYRLGLCWMGKYLLGLCWMGKYRLGVRWMGTHSLLQRLKMQSPTLVVDVGAIRLTAHMRHHLHPQAFTQQGKTLTSSTVG